MKQVNNILLTVKNMRNRIFITFLFISFLALSCNAIIGEYQILSIKTLRNGIYLLYLKDNGITLKAITRGDSIDNSHVINDINNIKEGKSYRLSLSSLYKSAMKDYPFSYLHFYRGIVERGNKIPIESESGGLSDIYLINNVSGLKYKPIDENKSDKEDPALNIKTQKTVLCNGVLMDSIDATFVKDAERLRGIYSNLKKSDKYVIYGFASWQGYSLDIECERVYFIFGNNGDMNEFIFNHNEITEINEKKLELRFDNDINEIFAKLIPDEKKFFYGSRVYGRGYFCRYLSYIDNGDIHFEITQPNIGYDKFPDLGNYEQLWVELEFAVICN